mmetsp:Transcript_15707/g.40634  ORF Transcript_15707/g.40634 Transcript_15707/m.40634 type:complete len:167 (+) Transcript_15707:61-561(+)
MLSCHDLCLSQGGVVDISRTLYTAIFAACFIGPVGHFWYIFLEHAACQVFAQGTTAYVALKVIADSLVECPLDVAAFFCFMEFVRGGGVTAAQAKLSRDFWPTYLAQMTFWPLYQWFNFSMVPVEHQLLVVNFGCILDCTFLCWANSQEGWADRLLLSMRGSVQSF